MENKKQMTEKEYLDKELSSLLETTLNLENELSALPRE